ncbi:MAG: RICIN domain-containing protein [Sandaracinaceae bacterium]|nr:RICIN domain-containing protein [Sandaracinaceae bacterium]
MASVVPSRLLALALLACASVAAIAGPEAPSIAHAQAALVPVLVQSRAGQCLAVTPLRNVPGASPSMGWRVIVEPCSGRSTQRWGQVVGDYQDFVFEPGLCVGQVQGSEQLELADCHTMRPVLTNTSQSPDAADTTFRVGDLCMTAPTAAAPGTSPYVKLAPCDGRPEQHWRVSTAR